MLVERKNERGSTRESIRKREEILTEIGRQTPPPPTFALVPMRYGDFEQYNGPRILIISADEDVDRHFRPPP